MIQNLQRSPLPQTSNWSGTFFAASYSKPAPASMVYCNRADWCLLSFPALIPGESQILEPQTESANQGAVQNNY